MVEDREILRLNRGINKLCYFFINVVSQGKTLFLINSSQLINSLSKRLHKQLTVIAS